MPTYEYVCVNCNHKLVTFQPVAAKPRKKCPECKKRRLRRVPSAGVLVIFKGPGFYQTDYKTPPKPDPS